MSTGVVTVDERLIGTKMARKLLGVPTYHIIKDMVRRGYVKGVYKTVRTRHRLQTCFLAPYEEWFKGYQQWRADQGLPVIDSLRRSEDVSARQAVKLLGVSYTTVQRLVKEGYVQVRRGPSNSLLAPKNAWLEGFERFKQEHWSDTVDAQKADDGEQLLSMHEAQKLLRCARDTVNDLVHRGYVKTRRDRRTGGYVAPRSAWIKGFKAYMRERGRKVDTRRFQDYEIEELMAMHVMNEAVLTGMALCYGQRPRCYVCGRPLHVGDQWRWFVPSPFQPRSKSGTPVPAFGCAEGHEGTVIEVAGTLYRIQPAGQPPEVVEEVMATCRR